MNRHSPKPDHGCGDEGEAFEMDGSLLIPREAAHPFRDDGAPLFREMSPTDSEKSSPIDSGILSPGIEGVTGLSAGCV